MRWTRAALSSAQRVHWQCNSFLVTLSNYRSDQSWESADCHPGMYVWLSIPRHVLISLRCHRVKPSTGFSYSADPCRADWSRGYSMEPVCWSFSSLFWFNPTEKIHMCRYETVNSRSSKSKRVGGSTWISRINSCLGDNQLLSTTQACVGCEMCCRRPTC